MGNQGLGCLSLHVDVVDQPLKLSVSAVELPELVTSKSGSAELELGLELCGEVGVEWS